MKYKKKDAGSTTFTFHILLSPLLSLFFPDFFLLFLCGGASLKLIPQ